MILLHSEKSNNLTVFAASPGVPVHINTLISVPSDCVSKAISIFLLGIYMLTFAEFHHFLRIPVLVQHFKEHRQLDPSITFLNFLHLHYVGEIVVDDDYQRDNQLPFREADCCITSMTLSCECPGTTIEITSPPTEITNYFKLYNEDNNSLLSVTDIFQPPRPA